MLHHNTLNEIRTNINTGVEYKIALFYTLLSIKPDEQILVLDAIKERSDSAKIQKIISYTTTTDIYSALSKRHLTLADITFETQNDDIGPADVVMFVTDINGNKSRIGLSIKYANKCSLNVTGKRFIPDIQIKELRNKLPEYAKMYIKAMDEEFGAVNKWFRQRKTSKITDDYIDLIRDAVIKNWENVNDKTTLLSTLFHRDSPIEFWVATYAPSKSYSLKTKPQTVDVSRADDITVGKYQNSYVAFYLDGDMVGHMQVKFNNGILERCKKTVPDIIHQGVPMAYGQPFSSWNFNVEQ